MKLINLGLALGLIGVLAGCAGGEHIYTNDGRCLTCINNPLTGKPINHDGSAPGSTIESRNSASIAETAQADEPAKKSSSYIEQTTTFSAPIDVDVAFVKVKKEYRYYTEQEIRQEWGIVADDKLNQFDTAYSASPSAYYHMRAPREHGNGRYVIDHKIEKQATDKSQITITVWVREDSPITPADVASSLALRTKAALTR